MPNTERKKTSPMVEMRWNIFAGLLSQRFSVSKHLYTDPKNNAARTRRSFAESKHLYSMIRNKASDNTQKTSNFEYCARGVLHIVTCVVTLSVRP